MNIRNTANAAGLCVFLALAVNGWCASLPLHWTAKAPHTDSGLSLVEGPHSHWRMESVAGTATATLIPVRDYYSRACFLVRLNHPVAGPLWLRARYLDRGYGLISVNYGEEGGQEIPQQSEWGVARLNTGKIREAAFEIDPTRLRSPEPMLRIEGLTMLVSLTLTAEEPPRTPVTDVAPAIEFRVPG